MTDSNNVDQGMSEPDVSLNDLIIRAGELHVISELEAALYTRALDPKKVRAFTHQLLSFALDRIEELQTEEVSA